ncbi:LPXTG cell wall anchor domain-containing protein [Acetanaerobacterium elongatum]|uniref:LPXTG-motif cell wall anchor domain-containing protein n=1 Tax=Acetanaerobacterium elongatum TaxID=258515 RepID=A0A1G9V2D2_9FIRM|nr:LPXTG cell wall anchor domain-containing protein [Acetanaerobacterium elongatum]SDM66278.1 LPXTG-motif cell wall anchor domain-containing protein [Acetanaerobacterium elongatum]
MKKLFTRILVCAAVAVLLLSGFAVNALSATSEVVLTSGAGDLISDPADDLFQNFKGLMPSMKVDQLINLKNKNARTVNLYLKMEAAEEVIRKQASDGDSVNLLKALNLKLTLKKPNGQTTVFYDGSAYNSTGGSKIFLGKYAPGSTGSITATVSMPKELGNEYQNLEGKVRWIFSCEEVVESSSGTTSTSSEYITTAATRVTMPNTGGFPILALVPIGAVLVVGGLFLGRKNQQK